MWMLWLSIVALLVGVGVFPLVRQRPAVLAALDAFVLFSVGGLVVLHLVPHSIERGGVAALLAVLVGGGLPFVFHALSERGHRHGFRDEAPVAGARPGHDWVATLFMVAVFVGLAGHALLDGMALALGGHDHGHGHGHDEAGHVLAMGVLLHRLPVGVFLGWMVVPVWGSRRAFALAGVMALATVAGFWAGEHALHGMGAHGLVVLQALIAGMLLHVLLHHEAPAAPGRSGRWAALLGALVGTATLVVVIGEGFADKQLAMVWSLAEQVAPWWLAAALVVLSLVGRWRLARRGDGAGACRRCPRWKAGLLGWLGGHALPGQAPSGWRLAAGSWSVEATLLTVVVFGVELALWRAVLWLLPLGWVLWRERGEASGCEHPEAPLRYWLDGTLPWLVMALIGAAVLLGGFPAGEWVPSWGWPVVFLFTVAGLIIPMSPVAAVFGMLVLVERGAPLGAGFAFSVAATSLGAGGWRTLWVRRGARVALQQVAVVVAVALGSAWALERWWQGGWGSVATLPSWLGQVALALIAGLLLWRMAALGPRALVQRARQWDGGSTPLA